MKRLNILKPLALICALTVFTACEETPSNPTGKSEFAKVNEFISETVENYYLWQDHLKYPLSGSDKSPFEYFDKLVEPNLDKWSQLTDDADSFIGGINNDGTTFGYSLMYGRFKDTDRFFAIVQFVFEGSPAEEAKLKRGDVIVKVNGKDITLANYTDLHYLPQTTVTLGYWNNGTIGTSNNTVTITARKMYLDPVVKTDYMEIDGHKIGYLFFSDYVTGSHGRLTEVFADFKAKGIEDLVLDLRYNGGGATTTATHLASMIGPVTGKDVFYNEHYNKKFEQYLIQAGRSLKTYFDSKITQSALLKLPRVYILTSDSSASASELTIVGLEPYMDVITIGTQTHGKYCGGHVMQPEIYKNGQWTIDPEIGNWALYLMTFKYSNAEGRTDFGDGLAPKHEVEEDIADLKPLGDPADPLFAKAISLITNAAEPASVKKPTTDIRPIPGLISRTGNLHGKLIKDDFEAPQTRAINMPL